jgi:hypothetical protein
LVSSDYATGKDEGIEVVIGDLGRRPVNGVNLCAIKVLHRLHDIELGSNKR